MDRSEILKRRCDVIHCSQTYNILDKTCRSLRAIQLMFQKYIYVIYRMGGPYWKNILSRSQKRPEAEGQETFLRPRQNVFPVRTDLNGK